jgi:anti-sigma B factor antagonist
MLPFRQLSTGDRVTTLQPARRAAPNPDDRLGEAPFEIQIQPDRERVILALRGELDLATVDRVREAIHELVAAGFEAIVLDLHEVSFMDSTGLCLVVEQAGRRDATIQVVDGAPPVARLFDLTGLRPILPFVDARQLRVRR